MKRCKLLKLIVAACVSGIFVGCGSLSKADLEANNVQIETIIAEGDYVAVYATYSGVQNPW